MSESWEGLAGDLVFVLDTFGDLPFEGDGEAALMEALDEDRLEDSLSESASF